MMPMQKRRMNGSSIQTGSGEKAITAIARRLAIRIRRVLIDKTPYRINGRKHLQVKRESVKRFVLKKA